MYGVLVGCSRNSGAGAPGRKIPATIFRLLSSSATYVVPFSMTGFLSPVALFRAGTIHDHAIGQAGPSILSRLECARPLRSPLSNRTSLFQSKSPPTTRAPRRGAVTGPPSSLMARCALWPGAPEEDARAVGAVRLGEDRERVLPARGQAHVVTEEEPARHGRLEDVE